MVGLAEKMLPLGRVPFSDCQPIPIFLYFPIHVFLQNLLYFQYISQYIDQKNCQNLYFEAKLPIFFSYILMKTWYTAYIFYRTALIYCPKCIKNLRFFFYCFQSTFYATNNSRRFGIWLDQQEIVLVWRFHQQHCRNVCQWHR